MLSNEQFLPFFFADIPADKFILIWTMSKDGTRKVSRWFSNAVDAVSYVRTVANTPVHVYFGMGLSPTAKESYQRCQAQDIAGITCVWVDIDIFGPHHAKKNLPPTEADAFAMLDEAFPLEPTTVIHTGGGLQAYWLLKEPWIFDTAEDRAKAAALVADIIYTLRAHARTKGWDIDATVDLARVFRVPGSFNQKSDPPEPVHVIAHSGKAYNPSDFEPYLLGKDEQASLFSAGTTGNGQTRDPIARPAGSTNTRISTEAVTITTPSGPLVIDPTAQPPFDKFSALQDLDDKFRQTWERKRRDLPDQTASSYDMSLANYAVMAGWNDQEVIDLLIAFRRRHNEKLKYDGYFLRTIERARRDVKAVDAREFLSELPDATAAADIVTPLPTALPPDIGGNDAGNANAATPVKPGITPEYREKIRENVSTLLQLEILRVIRYTSEPPQYRVETGKGSFRLKNVDQLINLKMLQSAIAASTGFLIPDIKKEWRGVAQGLLWLCEDVDPGDEATEAGSVRSWLTEYLSEVKPQPFAPDMVKNRSPYIRDGHIHISGIGFRRWLKNNLGDDISAKEMGVLFKGYGCIAVTVFLEDDERGTSRQVWKLPPLKGFHSLTDLTDAD